MGCPHVCGDNPRAEVSGLSNLQVDTHGIIILYHLHQCRHLHITGCFVLKLVRVVSLVVLNVIFCCFFTFIINCTLKPLLPVLFSLE